MTLLQLAKRMHVHARLLLVIGQSDWISALEFRTNKALFDVELAGGPRYRVTITPVDPNTKDPAP